ncbi:MAG TPA: alkaline phosphatase family protein [Gaiellaceae bacterium]
MRAVRTLFARLAELFRSLFGRTPPAPAGFVRIALDDSVAALDEIEHIVVLMLENRSFDHMLGYLSLEPGGLGVDGLRAGMTNEHEGRSYPIFRLEQTAFTKAQDPCHSGECVDHQVAGGMGGFAADYIETRADPRDAEPVVVMGYYDGEQLPVYDFLARRFCVCDQWFCSLKGATFPNRLYAVAGRSAGSRDNASPPVYHLPSFVRKLDDAGATWRWYTHELFATIWAIDRDYLPRTLDNVRPFSSPFSSEDFFSAAKSGSLPDVAWIDPNFVDVGGAVGSNDDHPPSDVRAGQELVLHVVNALVRSPAWERTLLVLTYDEHGGFFDHAEPPSAEDDDPRPEFHAYGPRVPTFAVSPRVRPGVSHELFDHTSLIKTCLARFCRDEGGLVPDMGARVNAANHLGAVLEKDVQVDRPGDAALDGLASELRRWGADSLQEGIAVQSDPVPPDPAALTDFQRDYVAARTAVLDSLTPSEREQAAKALGM